MRFETSTMQILLLLAFAVTPAVGSAQSYPSKPIRIISGSPPGNSSDVAIRMVAPLLGASLGQPVLVENRQAAGGQVAALAIKSSAPDGHNLLLSGSSAMVSAAYLVRNVAYDSLTDFAPVTKLISVPSVIATSSAVRLANVQDLIDYARAKPGALAYGSSGNGTVFHMIGESLAIDAGIKMLHVPYSSGGLGLIVGDLASNRIQVFFPSLTSLMPVLTGGNVKVIAVLDRQRLKAIPDVPTIYEQYPGYTAIPSWFGVLGPAGMPPSIVRRLHAELHKAVHQPDVTSKLEGLASIPVASTPEEFAQEIKTSVAAMGKLTKALGISPE